MSSRQALLVASAVTPHEPSLPPLRGAQLDAWAFYDALTDADVGLFHRSEVRVLQNPHSQEVHEELAKITKGSSADDMLLIYFSGHGLFDVRNGTFYWATADTR